MGKYYFQEEGISISTDLKPQFGDIELFGTLLQWREKKKSPWEQISVGGSITANVACDGNAIFIGSCDKNFYAVGLDGRERWRLETGGVVQAGAMIDGNTVHFGSADNNLYALDSRKGKVRWKFKSTGPIRGVPYMHEGRIYFGTGDGKLFCIDRKGKELWNFPSTGALGSPFIADGRIFIGYEDCCMHCLNMSGGELWSFKTGAFITFWAGAYHEGKVYFGSWDRNVYAVSADKGRLLWKFAPDETPMSPVVWDGKVYFGTTSGSMYCLEADTGKQIWRFRKASGTMANIRMHEGKIYCGSYDNSMYCIDALTGKMVWKFNTNGFVHGMPAVCKGLVVFGSWDCNLYAVTADDGKLVWKFPTSLSSPSSIGSPEEKKAKTAEIVWTPEAKKEKKKYKGNEVDIADYGTFSGTYIDTTKMDYLGERKKGYLK